MNRLRTLLLLTCTPSGRFAGGRRQSEIAEEAQALGGSQQDRVAAAKLRTRGRSSDTFAVEARGGQFRFLRATPAMNGEQGGADEPIDDSPRCGQWSEN